MKEFYKIYCTGCGLCQNKFNIKLTENNKGFYLPEAETKDMSSFCDQVCPMGPNGVKKEKPRSLWGNYRDYYIGYSKDECIRYRAASGGIISSVCIWLLRNNIVDGIIQVKADPSNILVAKVSVSDCEEDVVKCSGSRYSQSVPLEKIDNLVEIGKKYAFVGKPCDVTALKNYSAINQRIENSIIYYISFFCAGAPSNSANRKLITELGASFHDCKYIHYRGDGWPGKTIVYTSSGKEYATSYENAWMNILGRELRQSCKFCLDSIGENADISCGDYWFVDSNNRPILEENDGVNCIFSWSEKGTQILNQMQQSGDIILEQADISLLPFSQPNHAYRRSSLFYRLCAMKLLFKSTPYFDFSVVKAYAKYITLRKGLGAFKGTIKRIISKRID